MIADVFVRNSVQLIRGDPWADGLPSFVKGISGDGASNANLLNRFLVLDVGGSDALWARMKQVFWTFDIVGDVSLGGELAGFQCA